jgi:thiamine pyrophosphokinase
MTGRFSLDCLKNNYDALLISNGTAVDRRLFAALRKRASLLIALDGGINQLFKLKSAPDHVIGDFDSAAASALKWATEHGSRIHRRPSVDEPDIAKALKFCVELGCRNVLLAGAGGERLDHVLASLSFVARIRALKVTLVTNEVMVLLLRGRVSREFPVPFGHSVSWFGFPEAQGCSLSGVRWPVRNRTLRVDGFHSLSNEPIESDVRLTQRSGSSVFTVSLFPKTTL